MNYDAGEYLNNNASSVYSVMQSSKMLFLVSHGGPGFVQCFDSSGNISTLCGDRNNDYYIHSYDKAVSDLPIISPKNNRLTIFFACESGKSPDPIPDSSQIGGYLYPLNLITSTGQRSSKCAIGWEDVLYANSAKPWFEYFTTVSKSSTIIDSIKISNRLMNENYGVPYATKLAKYITRGSTN